MAFGIPGVALPVGWMALMLVLSINAGGHSEPFPEWVSILFRISIFVGPVLLVIGLSYYALAKGYSAALGILGLFSCIGFLILFFLPDRAQHQDDVAA
ncbi:MAG TPA: hypothetical protein VN048_07560 [Verrucomicrobiae bacterium]|nr:hypothetical protein [Verrucomicrobiae bacterium]